MKLKKRKIKYAAIVKEGNLIAEIPESPLSRHMIEASKQS